MSGMASSQREAGSPMRLFGFELPDWRHMPFLGTVKVQKELKIQNKRLAWLHLVLVVVALVIACYNVIWEQPWWGVYVPRARGLELWSEAGDVLASMPSYCHAQKVVEYFFDYGSGWLYSPSGCKELPAGERSRKLGGILFLPTYVNDLYVHQKNGQQECALEEARCATVGGNFSSNFSSMGDTCTCERPEEFLVPNVETLVIKFNHGYQASTSEFGPHIQSARSHEDGVTDKSYDDGGNSASSTVTAPGILSVIRSRDGRECSVGGRSRWEPKDGSIHGTVEEWLRCGYVGLDMKEPSLRSNFSSSSAPRARIAGANVELVLTYSNLRQRHTQVDWDGPVCTVWVNAFPVWNSQTHTDYAVLPDSSMPTATSSWRYRYSYGVSFYLSVDGTIGVFDFFRLFTAIMTNIVLLGLPIRVVTFVAIYGAGAASVIYKRIQVERFNIRNEFHGFVARLLCHGQSFRGLTNTKELTKASLKKADLVKFMTEAFLVQEKRGATASGTPGGKLTRAMSSNAFERAMIGSATEQTVDDLAQVVIAGCDPEGDGCVSLAEFIYAASCNESLHMNEVVSFFDINRKKGIMERLFGDTEFDPQQVRDHLMREQHMRRGLTSSSSSANQSAEKLATPPRYSIGSSLRQGLRKVAPEGGSRGEAAEEATGNQCQEVEVKALDLDGSPECPAADDDIGQPSPMAVEDGSTKEDLDPRVLERIHKEVQAAVSRALQEQLLRSAASVPRAEKED